MHHASLLHVCFHSWKQASRGTCCLGTRPDAMPVAKAVPCPRPVLPAPLLSAPLPLPLRAALPLTAPAACGCSESRAAGTGVGHPGMHVVGPIALAAASAGRSSAGSGAMLQHPLPARCIGGGIRIGSFTPLQTPRGAQQRWTAPAEGGSRRRPRSRAGGPPRGPGARGHSGEIVAGDRRAADALTGAPPRRRPSAATPAWQLATALNT